MNKLGEVGFALLVLRDSFVVRRSLLTMNCEDQDHPGMSFPSPSGNQIVRNVEGNCIIQLDGVAESDRRIGIAVTGGNWPILH